MSGFNINFGAADYVVFSLMLAISFGIGIFHALKPKDSDDFLSGGKTIGLIPIAISLCASFNSATLILGIPSEIYHYGAQFLLILLGMFICIVITSEIWIPILYNLKVVSVYEYFNLRYKSPVPRRIMSAIFIIKTLLYSAIVMYAPSIALSTLTPIPWWASILLLGVSSTTYTAMGGLRAIVWTDVFQIVFMVSSLLTIMIKGLILTGGFSEMWAAAEAGGRINFTFSGNIFERHTFWNLLFGSLILWGSPYATSQFLIHRCLCLRTPREGKISLYVNFCGQILLLMVVSTIGLTLYTFYQDCDPVSAGLIPANDAIVPFFVSQQLANIPGLSGLFIACLFSGALSTLDSSCHGLAIVTWEELGDISRFNKLTKGKETSSLRILSVAYGLLIVGMAFLCSNLGSLIQMAGVIMGGCLGPMFAYVLISILLPFVNLKGSLIGLISGQLLNVWLSVGSAIRGQKYPPLDLSVAGCGDLFNVTTFPPPKNITGPPTEWTSFNDIYAMSYNLYPIIGFVSTVIFTILASLATGGWNESKDLDVKFVNQKIGKFFKKK